MSRMQGVNVFGAETFGIGLLLIAGWCAAFPFDALGESSSSSLAATIPAVVALLVCALKPEAIRAYALKRNAVLALGIVALLGRALRMMAYALPSSYAAALVGTASYSAAEAIILVLWLDACARMSSSESSKTIPLAFLIAGAVSFATDSLNPWIPGSIATVAPFASALMLSRATSAGGFVHDLKPSSDMQDDADAAEDPQRFEKWTFPFFPVAIMAAYCFAFRFTLAYTLGPSAWGPLGMLLIAAAAVAITILARDAYHPSILFKCAFPLMLAGLLAVGFLDDWRFLATLFTNAGNTAFRLFILVALVQLCFRFSINAIWMFGIVEAAERLASALGDASGASFASSYPTSSPESGLAIAAIIVVLSVLSMSLYSDRVAHQTFGTNPKKSGEEGADGVMSYYEKIVRDCERAARAWGLTRREQEILELLVQGDTVAQAAEKLYISPGTAKTHVAHIYRKMGVHSRAEACALVRS